MSIDKLNIENKQDSPAKQKLIASGDISTKETLTAKEINELTAKTNELVDAYNFGTPITGFNFKENVPTYADLPTADNEVNDGYGVIADGLIYVWNGTAFPPEGQGMDLNLRPNGKVEKENKLAVSGDEVFKSAILTADLQTELPLNYRFNEYVDTITGNYSANPNRACIDLLPINDSEEIIISRSENSGISVVFYDADKNYIGRVVPDDLPIQRVFPLPGSAFMSKVFSTVKSTRNADFLQFKVYQKNNPLLKLKGIYNSPFVDLELSESKNIYAPSMVLDNVCISSTGIISEVSDTTLYAMAVIPVEGLKGKLTISTPITASIIAGFISSAGDALEIIEYGFNETPISIPSAAKWLFLNVSSSQATRDKDKQSAVVVNSEDLSGDISFKKISKINGYDLAVPESSFKRKKIYPVIEYGAIHSLGHFNTTWYGKKYQRTTNYIDVSGNNTIMPLTDIDCEFRVHYYDRDFVLTRTTGFYPTNSQTIKNQPHEIYAKFTFRKNEQIDDLPIFNFWLEGIFEENWNVKNVRNEDGYQPLMVPVNVANVNASDSKTNDVQDFEEILPDYGLLALPATYSNTAEPTRLIIYCHGAGVNYVNNVSVFPPSDIRPEYWLSEGYAVMDIEGNPFDNVNEHFYIPQAIQSYISAYEWVLKAYNIKTDGIFLGGRSMGGGMVFDVLQSKIPVIAACPLVPVANTLLVWNYMNQGRRTFTANHLGIPNYAWTNSNPMTEGEWNHLKDNFAKLVKYSPMWRGITNLPDKDSLFSVGRINSSTSFNQDENDLYSSLNFQVKSPIKLFGVEDDATVPYRRNAELMYRMLINGGNICELRVFETGGHHFEIDNPDCLTSWTNSRGQLLEDVPVVYIEMLQFWKRYE